MEPVSPGFAFCAVDSASDAIAPFVACTAQLPTSVMGSATDDWLPTATEAVAVRPPAVALTVARPAPAAAVNRPPALTLPSEDGVTLQAASAAPRVSGAPPPAVADSVNCCVPPFCRSGWLGLTLRLAAAPATVSGTRDRARPDRPAVRLVPPPVTRARPGGCTEIRAGSAAGLPCASVAYAAAGSVVPASTVIGRPPLTTARAAGPGEPSVL